MFLWLLMDINCRFEKHIILGLTALALTGCQSVETVGSAEDLPPVSISQENSTDEVGGTFASGDLLELFVKEDATLNGSYLVRDGGYIVIPRAGRISVAGLDRSSAETRVKESLQRTQLTEATVLVERTSKAKVAGLSQPGVEKIMIFVTGAVPRSGAHQVPVNPEVGLGLYEALLITGGINRFGNEQRVELLRKDGSGQRHQATIDLKAIRQGLALDPRIGEGDIIRVPEKVFGF